MKHFFLIDERRLEASSEGLRLIGQAVAALYSGLRIEKELSDECGEKKSFFLIRNQWELIWARVFFEPLRQRDLYELESEAHKAFQSICEFREPEARPVSFIFYPGLCDSETREVLTQMPAHWKFFEYSFLQGDGQEALALKENKSSGSSLVTDPLLDASGNKPESDLTLARLCDEELKALLELSYQLGNYASPDSQRNFYVSAAYQDRIKS
ncbi:MAG: hypothetical protein H6757_06045 [Candidatus Omnitrophica bacterium]|nr:hypothetical protein [Candidatus Omnitrophota bacterium]